MGYPKMRRRVRSKTARKKVRSADYRWRQAGKTAGSYAYKAYQMAKYVKGLVNTEYKFNDYNVTNVNIDYNAWQWQCLNLIPQGDDNNQRSGRSIRAKSLALEADFTLKGALNNGVVRLILVRFNSCSGGSPTGSDLYTIFTGVNAVNSFRQIQTTAVPNYTVLWDKRFAMDADYKSQIHVSKYWKLNNHIKFVGTSAAIGSMGNYSYFLGVISDTAPSATDYVAMDYYTRIRYVDN